jgi:hypothetical protein
MTGRILRTCAVSSFLGIWGCGDDTSVSTETSGGSTGTETSPSTSAETSASTSSATTAETSASTTAETSSGETTTTDTTTDATSSGSTDPTTSTESSSTDPSGSSSDTGAEVCCEQQGIPPCVEGEAMCCVDGSWACPDEGGRCEGGLGEICDGPPPPEDCCDPDAVPDCMDNEEVECCTDGWQCLEIGGEVCAPGIVCEGERCQGPDESCANGETCCGGLECCSGVPVPPGQEFCSQMCPISDRNRKRDFEPVDAAEVLDKVVALPITTWSYKFEDPSIRHIGPMAQDFRAAFGVGKTEKLIFQVDADGVALASIQALHAKIETLEREKQALQDTLESVEQRLAKLEARD